MSKVLYDILKIVHSIQKQSENNNKANVVVNNVTNYKLLIEKIDLLISKNMKNIDDIDIKMNFMDIDSLVTVFPIVHSMIITQLEAYVYELSVENILKQIPNDVSKYKAYTVLMDVYLHVLKKVGYVRIQLFYHEHVLCSKIDDLLRSQYALFGRSIFCCTALLQALKASMNETPLGSMESFHQVVINEYICNLLTVLHHCISTWDFDIYIPSTTGCKVTDSKVSLPKSLTGPYFAQIIEILLHHITLVVRAPTKKLSSSMYPAAYISMSVLLLLIGDTNFYLDMDRTGHRNTDVLCNFQHCLGNPFLPPRVTSHNRTTHRSVHSKQKPYSRISIITAYDVTVWRTYFPGVFSSLQSVCIDKPKYCMSSMQSLAMVLMLQLFSVVMQDSLNMDTIRHEIIDDELDLNATLTPEQKHYYSVMMSKAKQSGIVGSGHAKTSIDNIKPSGAVASRRASSETQELPRTDISSEWRADILQRLAVHFPPTFKHVYQCVNMKYRVIITLKLASFIGECREFLGNNGLLFAIPLITLGLVDTSYSNGHVKDTKDADAVDSQDVLAEANSGTRNLLELLYIVKHGIVYAPNVNSNIGIAPVPVSVQWEHSIRFVLFDSIRKALKGFIADISVESTSGVVIPVHKNTVLPGSGVGVSAQAQASVSTTIAMNSRQMSAAHHMLKVVLGCGFLLDGLSELFMNDNETSSKLLFSLIYLLTPSSNPEAKVLRESHYVCLVEKEIDPSNSVSSKKIISGVSTGYYQIPLEHLSHGAESMEIENLVRRCCHFGLGLRSACGGNIAGSVEEGFEAETTSLTSGIEYLLQQTKAMEHNLRKCWKSYAEFSQEPQSQEGDESRRNRTSGSGEGHAEDQTMEDDSNNGLKMRIQLWKQSISRWKCLGYSVLGSVSVCFSISDSTYGKDTLRSSIDYLSKYDTATDSSAMTTDSACSKNKEILKRCQVCNIDEKSLETKRSSLEKPEPQAPASLRRCTRCKSVYYCCKEHQVVDWKSHKLVCEPKHADAENTESLLGSAHTPGAIPRSLDNLIIDPEKLLTNAQVLSGHPCGLTADVVAMVDRVIGLCMVEINLYLKLSVVYLEEPQSNRGSESFSDLVIQQSLEYRRNPDALVDVDMKKDRHTPTRPKISPHERAYMSLRLSTILECMGHCAYVNPKGFRHSLIIVLYPLLECSVDDSDYVVKQAAVATLKRIACYCGYGQVENMLKSNLDYVIDPLCSALYTQRERDREEGGENNSKSNSLMVFTNSLMFMKNRNRRMGRENKKRYLSHRTPAIVELVISQFAAETYKAADVVSTMTAKDTSLGGFHPAPLAIISNPTGQNSIEQEPKQTTLPMALMRDMVRNIMFAMDDLGGRNRLSHPRVLALLKVLGVMSKGIVNNPDTLPKLLMHTDPASGSMSGLLSRSPILALTGASSGNISEGSTSGASMVVDAMPVVLSFLAEYNDILVDLELPGNLRRDPADGTRFAVKGCLPEPPDTSLEDDEMDLTTLRNKSPGFNLLLDILERCPYFLASTQLDAQIQVAEIMVACIQKLSPCKRLLLPAVHQAWSPIMSRMKEMLIILKYYYNTPGPIVTGGGPVRNHGQLPNRAALRYEEDDEFLSSPVLSKKKLYLLPYLLELLSNLALITTDFVTSKFQEDLWPVFLDILKLMSRDTMKKMEEFHALQSRQQLFNDSKISDVLLLELRIKHACVQFLYRVTSTIGCQPSIFGVIPSCSFLLVPFLWNPNCTVESFGEYRAEKNGLESMREQCHGERSLARNMELSLQSVTLDVLCLFNSLDGGPVTTLVDALVNIHDPQSQSLSNAAWLSTVTNPSIVDVCSSMFVTQKSLSTQIQDKRRHDSVSSFSKMKLIDSLQHYMHYGEARDDVVLPGAIINSRSIQNRDLNAVGLIEVKSTRKLLPTSDSRSNPINTWHRDSKFNIYQYDSRNWKCSKYVDEKSRERFQSSCMLPSHQELYTLYSTRIPHSNAKLNLNDSVHSKVHAGTNVEMCDIPSMCTFVHTYAAFPERSVAMNAIWKKELERNTYA